MVALMVVTKAEAATAHIAQMQQSVRLSRQEARVLEYLATNEGRYVSGSELIDALWGGYGSESSPRVYVYRLREKLGAEVIDSWEAHGYRLVFGQADRLTWRCGRCGVAIAEYGAGGWVCYACGASGERPGRRADEPMTRLVECAYCRKEITRAISDQEYEQKRSPGRSICCSLSCASKLRWARERERQRESKR